MVWVSAVGGISFKLKPESIHRYLPVKNFAQCVGCVRLPPKGLAPRSKHEKRRNTTPCPGKNRPSVAESGFLGFHKCIDDSGRNGRLHDIFVFSDCWFDDWQDTVGEESVADYPPVWLQMDCVLKSSWSHRGVIVPLDSGGGILDLPFADDMLLLGIFSLRTAWAAFDTLVSKSMSWHLFESECSPQKSVE